MQNIIVVETPDALLVVNKDGSNITELISKLKNRKESEYHTTVHRPWVIMKY